MKLHEPVVSGEDKFNLVVLFKIYCIHYTMLCFLFYGKFVIILAVETCFIGSRIHRQNKRFVSFNVEETIITWCQLVLIPLNKVNSQTL